MLVARRPGVLALGLLAVVVHPSGLAAQQETGFDTSKQWRIEQPAKNHLKLVGDVEARRGDMTFTADVIESFTDTHQVIATGGPGRPVVFTQGGQWLAAERVEFNTETQLGTFYQAYGSFSVASEPKRSMLGGQEPDVLFNGKKIQKVGPKKYRITDGAFTTCLQPTPRWNVSAGTLVLNLDRYVFLRGAVLRAKGLPVLYLPLLYYPINEEDRATGFLMPAYGTSTYRGFTLSNAFFWAINRSHDVTLLHDWFAKRGQGLGTEYRYVGAGGAAGDFRFYNLRERESSITSEFDGEPSVLPARRSYEVNGNINQPLGGTWIARGNVDYFSDIEVQQTYHTNIYDASRSQRSVNAGLTGTLGQLTLNATYRRNEIFSGTSNTTVYGGAPQVQITRGEQPLFGLPLYFGVSGEFVRVQREVHRRTGVTDSNLTRLDATPTLRFPFTQLRWLTVNTSLSLRETWWSRSRVAGTNEFVDDGISRRYAQLSARVVGPVLNRVFDTPGFGYAERLKHTIEPYVDIRRVTKVDNFDEIISNDGTDSIVGGTTSITYGMNNRLLAKRRGGEGTSSPREFVTVGLSQTYYSDSKASQYRPQLLDELFRAAGEQALPRLAVRPGVSDAADQRVAPDGVRRPRQEGPQSLGLLAAGRLGLAQPGGRLQPAPPDRLRRVHDHRDQVPARQLTEPLDDPAEPGKPLRRQLHLQLRHRPLETAEQPRHRILQCAVLRLRGGVPDGVVQLVAGEGQPVQLLVHPGGPRHLLQLLRRAGRRRRAIAAGTHQR